MKIKRKPNSRTQYASLDFTVSDYLNKPEILSQIVNLGNASRVPQEAPLSLKFQVYLTDKSLQLQKLSLRLPVNYLNHISINFLEID